MRNSQYFNTLELLNAVQIHILQDDYPMLVTLDALDSINHCERLVRKDYYQHEELVARGQVQPVAEEV